jgi:preprotein translocase subunit SecE
MAKISPVQFFRQARQEAARVTWPTRKEAVTFTIMVFVMVIVASLFFLLVDWLLSVGVSAILGLGG